eukprot:4718413-Amphidinium_carterae.1
MFRWRRSPLASRKPSYMEQTPSMLSPMAPRAILSVASRTRRSFLRMLGVAPTHSLTWWGSFCP